MTAPLYALTDTWNAGGTTFTALGMDITPTAYASTSKLIDFQLGGSSVFTVLAPPSGTLQGTAIGFPNYNSSLWGWLGIASSGDGILFGQGSTAGFTGGSFSTSHNSGNSVFYCAANASIAFRPSGSADTGPAADLWLTRDAAGVFSQRNGTNPQTQRVYNTFTDASNYERGIIDWQLTSNVLTIGAEAGGSGTLRNMLLKGAIIDAKQAVAGTLQESEGLTFLHRSLTSNTAYTNATGAQNWFSTAPSVTVEASTTYEFEGLLMQTNGTTSHTVALSFAGSATLTSIAYYAAFAASVLNTTIAANNTTMVGQAAATVVTAAIITAGTVIYIRGLVRINGAGTFTPQFAFSAAPGAGNNLANTHFKMRKVGSNTNTLQGPWA